MLVKSSQDRFKWLEVKIVPDIVKALGREEGEKFSLEIKVPTESWFMSAVFMMELIFSENERFRLVVKTPGDDQSTRDLMRTDILFRNEIIFYKKFAQNYKDYPKCFFIKSEPISKAVIVLEDVCELGYRSISSKEELGLKRALAAVREIGKLHGRGYVLKENDPEEFFGIVANLEDSRDENIHPACREYINTVSIRPIKYLRSVNGGLVKKKKFMILEKFLIFFYFY